MAKRPKTSPGAEDNDNEATPDQWVRFTVSIDPSYSADSGEYDQWNLDHRAYLEAVSGTVARVACPHCGPEGVIIPVLVQDIGVCVLMCDECEGVWMTANDLGSDRVESWSAFALRHGLPDTWAGLSILMPT